MLETVGVVCHGLGHQRVSDRLERHRGSCGRGEPDEVADEGVAPGSGLGEPRVGALQVAAREIIQAPLVPSLLHERRCEGRAGRPTIAAAAQPRRPLVARIVERTTGHGGVSGTLKNLQRSWQDTEEY